LQTVTEGTFAAEPIDFGHHALKTISSGTGFVHEIDDRNPAYIKIFYAKTRNQLLGTADLSLAEPKYFEHLYHLIECHTVILEVAKSINSMMKASYCGPKISMLVIDNSRLNVARLVNIECKKVQRLADDFKQQLWQVIRKSKNDWNSYHVLLDSSLAIIVKCQEIFDDLGLEFDCGNPCNIWRSTVHVLDMAVLSYVGAHVQSFGKSIAESIMLPSLQNASFLEPETPFTIIFRRMSFLCLGEFLGDQKAWVCELQKFFGPITLREIAQEPALYLSCDAETFADVWGPMWSSRLENDLDRILHYNVGNGLIIPWKEPAYADLEFSNPRDVGHCEIKANETLCHWISDKDSKDDSNLRNSTGKSLSRDDILLIGACVRLKRNDSCERSLGAVKEYLKDWGPLHELGTIKRSRYKESETVQAQVGWSGVAAGLQVNYKIRERNWKQIIVERWKNEPERRVPRILEYRLGVEISMCTQNARRQRLITLLGSDTMQKYLHGLSINWSNFECKKEFFAALSNEDHTAFRALWESHEDWRPDLGKAIGYCLQALADTGTNSKGLDVFWVPEPAFESMVTLEADEHTWIGLLKDSRDCCTMAVFNTVCLELSKDWAKSCRVPQQPGSSRSSDVTSTATFSSLKSPLQRRGETILETCIVLNKESVPRDIPCKSYHRVDGSDGTYRKRWCTSKLRYGDKLSFGENGKLKFIDRLGSGQILTVYKTPDAWGVLKGKSSKRYHHEYIRDEDHETRPVDVIVLSRSKVTNFILAQKEPGYTPSKTQANFRAAASEMIDWHLERPFPNIGNGPCEGAM
jgi:hypothetical protein